MKNIIKDRGSIYVEGDIWKIFKSQVNEIAPSKLFIIVDSNTKQYCLPYFLAQNTFQIPVEILEFKAGETNKNITSCLLLWEQMSIKGVDRSSVIINLGGGVVTDLGSFVASTIKRGIEFINIPTTLLGMVDASIGGKNGIDLGPIKNQIGVVKNPYSVFIDTSFLKTLPFREVLSGFAEILKHGLITSEKYWEEAQAFDNKDPESELSLIYESIEIKNNVVSKDPLEKGQRKTLNYGHTLGHAIESYCIETKSRQSLLHGEAVAIGMILATYISTELYGFSKEKLKGVTSTILEYFQKQDFSIDEIDSIIKYLVFDKKNANGRVYFVLLEDFGVYKIDCEVPNRLIYKAFDYYKNF